MRILRSSRDELTTVATAQTNGLRALLLSGGDTDRDLARGNLTATVLQRLIRRRPPRDADRAHGIRHAEIRRLATALREAAQALRSNRAQLATIIDAIAPGLTTRPGLPAFDGSSLGPAQCAAPGRRWEPSVNRAEESPRIGCCLAADAAPVHEGV